MRNYLFYILLICCCFGCIDRKERAAERTLDRAESLLLSDPQAAHIRLDSIEFPENLNARQNARWCMMSCRLADTIHTRLPYPHQLERAQFYLDRHGSPMEQVQVALYLGRAYMNEKLPEPAIQSYIKALQKSLRINNMNLSGYICSYMADAYEFQAAYDLSKQNYLQAASYFEQAGNGRSQGIAFRDVGRSYASMDSLDMALSYMHKADSLIRMFGDSLDVTTIYNGFGNIYAQKGEFELAEKYLWKSIHMDTIDNAPDYSVLACLYLDQNKLEQAEIYLERAKAPTTNPKTHIELLYHYSTLEEKKGNPAAALSYMKQYIDSTKTEIVMLNQSNMIEAAARYQHGQVIKENIQLHARNNRNFRLWIYTLLSALGIAILSLYYINRKNKRIYAQTLKLKEMKNDLLQLKNSLQQKQNELEVVSAQLSLLKQNHAQSAVYEEKQEEAERLNRQIQEQRLQMLQTSAIALHVRELAEHVVPNATKSPLTDDDWNAIRDLIQTVSPNLSTRLAEFDFNKNERDLCYLSFFELKTNGEAVLLNITTSSVNRYRQNLRRAFQVKARKQSLRDFLIQMP